MQNMLTYAAQVTPRMKGVKRRTPIRTRMHIRHHTGVMADEEMKSRGSWHLEHREEQLLTFVPRPTKLLPAESAQQLDVGAAICEGLLAVIDARVQVGSHDGVLRETLWNVPILAHTRMLPLELPQRSRFIICLSPCASRNTSSPLHPHVWVFERKPNTTASLIQPALTTLEMLGHKSG